MKLTIINQLIKSKKFDSALKASKSLLGVQENHMDALKLIARIYSAKGEPDKGLVYTERCVRMAPDSWVSHYLHASQLLLSGSFKKAADHLKKAGELTSPDTSILYSLAKAYYLAGNHEKAMDAVLDLLQKDTCRNHQKLAVQINAGLKLEQPTGVCFPENDYTTSGWAWDRSLPGKPLYIKIMRNNSCISTFKADLFREDILQEGIGDGKHGFRIRLPSRLPFDAVSFKIVSSTNREYSFFSLSSLPVIPVYTGAIEACPPNIIKGWAWNSKAPSQRLQVVLEDDLGNKTEVLSNNFDSTLLNLGAGDGRYCFQHKWHFPEHAPLCAVIRARIHGSGEYLSGSPCAVIDPERYLHAWHLYAAWLRHVDENPLFPPSLPELLQENFLFFLRHHGIQNVVQMIGEQI